ncbi:pseudouridine synthase [Dyella mobilis]|uniref:Pseudouridine synthase n=1 Tax=Dyella mobilis TaxID=1849582 RepID=A0ABS2KKL0_9GAMM|nr:pseudouridine synthase [Dyella mobilis]MBM7131696.1 rRNA pseudouridine synthase [Dyella mobilis]GLQ96328.1 pseudouridine synthase [Dyella mobilis]
MPIPSAPRFGLARVLSKLGVCSRSHAEKAVREGRVSVDGRIVRDPEQSADPERQHICLDGEAVTAAERVYLALNKPRGVVVSAADERGRDTVYALLADAGLPWLGPVGRLDKASEGLLLLSNDSVWAAQLTDPRYHVDKAYHVQIDAIPDPSVLERMTAGVADRGEHLSAKRVSVLRTGEKNAWLEVVLDEGRNRHIRRLLETQGIGVLRLIRVAIGELALGPLAKGQWRHLTAAEVAGLHRVQRDPGGSSLRTPAKPALPARSPRNGTRGPVRRK